MEKKRILQIFQLTALSVQLLAEILTSVVVLQLKMLPNKYVAVFIGGMVALLMGSCLFMLIKVKGGIADWRMIASGALALLLVCGCGVISKLALDAHDFLGSVTDDDSGARSTYILVQNEDDARSLTDTEAYRFGAVENYDVEHTQKMLDSVKEATGKPVELVYYPQASQLVDAFYRKEVDALLMNGASISLLIENDGYQDFLSDVRVLHTMTHEKDDDSDGKLLGELTKTPFVVYISGSDTRSQKLTVSRSDVNILAVVNPKTKQILLVNTPRDYYVPNPAGKNALDKLTHCGNYGVDCSIEVLETLYNIEIDRYAKINFTGFQELIDAIGGITIYSDTAFLAHGKTQIQKGENKLNGEQLLDFTRERDKVIGGDNGRGKNQMKVIKAVVEKLTSSKTLISNYAEILKSLEGMLATDMTGDEISSLVKMQLNDMASWDVQSFAVTGLSDYQETYSVPGLKLFVYWPKEDSIAHANKLIQRMLNGDVLSATDMTVSG